MTRKLAGIKIYKGPEPEPPPKPSGNYIDKAMAPQNAQVSHWRQPFRSYLETVPASTVLNGLGINLNCKAEQQEFVCQLLKENGFTRIRKEIGWNNIEYSTPTKLKSSTEKTHKAAIEAAKNNGLRPLYILNANSGEPCPSKTLPIKLTAPVAPGATEISVESTAGVVFGKSGISSQKGFGYSTMSKFLFVSEPSAGKLKLSRAYEGPELPAGEFTAHTLLYSPFKGPKLADGETPNPEFEETMLGWLNYTGVVANFIKGILGSEEFDLEIWNELSFGSAFLSSSGAYYNPPNEAKLATSGIETCILNRTCAYLHANFPNVWVNNGFTNTNFIGNGGGGPGIKSRSGHPYGGNGDLFPGPIIEGTQVHLDALGGLNGHAEGTTWVEEFTPTYRMWNEVYYTHEIQSECILRDLVPYENSNIWRGAPSNEGYPKDENGGMKPSAYLGTTATGSPIKLWITETNLSPSEGKKYNSTITVEDEQHIKAKVILREYLMYMNKGLNALYFYATGEGKSGGLELVSASFMEAIKNNPSEYPGATAGGEAITSMGRVMNALKEGLETITKTKNVELDIITDYAEKVQFKGKKEQTGKEVTKEEEERFPPLRNKDVFAFLPFQVSNKKVIIPMYINTLDMSQAYEGTGPTRFDLPEEKYKLKIIGVNGIGAMITALDPITNQSVGVEVNESKESYVEVTTKVTDYPRLLTIQEA